MKKTITVFLAAFVFFFAFTPLFAADEEKSVDVADAEDLKVEWGKDYRSLTITYPGGKYEYPKDMIKEPFPSPGKEPKYEYEKKWPIFVIAARWSEPLKDWPEKYRPAALGLTLMFACDAQLYEHIYPDIIKSSKVTFPPQYQKDAESAAKHSPIEIVRGEELGYEVTAKAGFGASDYKIKTKIRVGLSDDEKTIFYHDSPDYISDYLESRDLFFAIHEADDRLEYEAVTVCVCAPRGFLKDEALNRIEKSSKYFIQRLYDCLHGAPTEKEIDEYLDMVRKRDHEVDELFKQHDL